MGEKKCNRASEKLYIQSIQKYFCLTIMVSKFLIGFVLFLRNQIVNTDMIYFGSLLNTYPVFLGSSF